MRIDSVLGLGGWSWGTAAAEILQVGLGLQPSQPRLLPVQGVADTEAFRDCGRRQYGSHVEGDGRAAANG